MKNQVLPKESVWLALTATKASDLGGPDPAPDIEVGLILEAAVHAGGRMCSWP